MEVTEYLPFEKIAEYPHTPAGFSRVAASLSSDGEMLYTFVQADAAEAVFGKITQGAGVFPATQMPQPAQFRLFAMSAGGTREIALPPLDVTYPAFDLFPDGRVLVVGTRARWRPDGKHDRNGVIYDPRTGAQTRISLGDGIRQIGVDGESRIWVSYFDEGVFGNFGWTDPAANPPGPGGVVCFDETGKVLWSFNDKQEGHHIDDCYAMNVTRSDVFAYYYSDFAVAHVGADLSKTIFGAVPIKGSEAVAVSDSGILLTCQYKEAADIFHFIPRKGATLGAPRTLKAKWPTSDWKGVGLFLAYGSGIHVMGADAWYRAEVPAA